MAHFSKIRMMVTAGAVFLTLSFSTLTQAQQQSRVRLVGDVAVSSGTPPTPPSGPVETPASLAIPIETGVGEATSVKQVASETQSCVLLKNDNVLFGEATQVGEFVVVSTAKGGEIKLQRSEVACWADSIRNLYRFRVDHRSNGHLATHLRDARWCLRYDLYDLAVKELQFVRQLDPSNQEADAIEDRLRRQSTSFLRAQTSAVIESHSKAGMEPLAATHAFEAEDLNHKVVDPATLRRFASHIQPMLINRCGNCHQPSVHPADIGWSLLVPRPGSRASSGMTLTNLQATLPHLDPDVPEASSLLLKATSPHGGSKAPLHTRDAKAIQSLEYWILMATAAIANEQESRRVATREESLTSPIDNERYIVLQGESMTNENSNAVDSVPFVKDRPAMTLHVDRHDAAEQSRSENSERSQVDNSEPRRLPQVENPFDPDLFNRRFHPESSD